MSENEKLGLLNECRSVRAIVEPLNEDVDANEIGLTTEMLTDMVESRLRASRLYTDEIFYDADDIKRVVPGLYLRVHILNPAFAINVDFVRYLQIVSTGNVMAGATWDSGTVGTHGQDANYVIEAARKYVDIFILQYLRANEEYCN